MTSTLKSFPMVYYAKTAGIAALTGLLWTFVLASVLMIGLCFYVVDIIRTHHGYTVGKNPPVNPTCGTLPRPCSIEEWTKSGLISLPLCTIITLSTFVALALSLSRRLRRKILIQNEGSALEQDKRLKWDIMGLFGLFSGTVFLIYGIVRAVFELHHEMNLVRPFPGWEEHKVALTIVNMDWVLLIGGAILIAVAWGITLGE